MINPCPFCGGVGEVYPVPNFGYAVICTQCGSRGKKFDLPNYSSKKHYVQRLHFKAIQAWNTRC